MPSADVPRRSIGARPLLIEVEGVGELRRLTYFVADSG
jgi:hypothetical protein